MHVQVKTTKPYELCTYNVFAVSIIDGGMNELERLTKYDPLTGISHRLQGAGYTYDSLDAPDVARSNRLHNVVTSFADTRFATLDELTHHFVRNLKEGLRLQMIYLNDSTPRNVEANISFEIPQETPNMGFDFEYLVPRSLTFQEQEVFRKVVDPLMGGVICWDDEQTVRLQKQFSRIID
ncbi:MAG: hypothetical protein ACMXYD_03140 [Candidatus Woesearchaeota archaeon]